MAIAVVPDRKLATLGAYVTFKDNFRTKRGLRIKGGTVGVIVLDRDFLCKPDQIAVRLPGWIREYAPVPVKVLEIQRAKR